MVAIEVELYPWIVKCIVSYKWLTPFQGTKEHHHELFESYIKEC